MAIVLNSVEIFLGKTPLFPPVNLTVKPGLITTVMGPSGCGKSTLLSAICGNLDPGFSLSGDILLGGKTVLDKPMEKRRVGILFQDDLLFPHLDVFGNMAFALPPEIPLEQKKQRVKEVLAMAELEGFENRDVATLSGGQKARVSLLRTLLAEPEAILLDEPFSKLDKQLKTSVREFVFTQVTRMDIPALLVTHDPEDAPANRIYHLDSGEHDA